MSSVKVAVVMGSDTDWDVMKPAVDVLRDAKVDVISEVVSAHRTPEKMMTFSQSAQSEGFKVIIAGAGGAAHLPGMIASMTRLPVIGVPVALRTLDGMDSLLSIVQMPNGVPVATVGIGQAKNAGILALRILALENESVSKSLEEMMAEQTRQSLTKVLPTSS
ncbi:5-(carboxyamino)imidazole ribonucleotide mutase [Pontimonas sp.]|nr:5-(carboxyamino)imidazole ribonucleotide mutase [Pontimonas sp.]